jgi:hypothetical protein
VVQCMLSFGIGELVFVAELILEIQLVFYIAMKLKIRYLLRCFYEKQWFNHQ